MAFGPYIDMTRRGAGRFWQARTGDGPVERALWTVLALLLAIPIAVVIAVVLLLAVGLGLAMVLTGRIRRAFAGGQGPSEPADPGRENVRVVRRPDVGP